MKTFVSDMPQFYLKKEKSGFLKARVVSSRDAADVIRPLFGDDIEFFESFFMLMLNAANNTIGFVKISQGGMTSTVVDVRIIARYAIESLCTQVIIAHNHPSGNLYPSDADKRLTEKVKEGLKLLDIKVLDHIILSSDGFYSFADEGIL